MSPAKRRPATPSSDKAARAARKGSADRAPAEVVADVAEHDATPPAEARQPEPEVRPTTQSMARSRVLHPERIWPD